MTSRKSSNAGFVRRVWTLHDDSVLKHKILTNGRSSMNWNEVALSFPGRTGKQCRERWHHHLREGIKKGEWSEKDDATILSSHARLGNRWSKISKLLTKRSDNDVKNRYKTLQKMQKGNDLLSNSVMKISENVEDNKDSKSDNTSIAKDTTTSSSSYSGRHFSYSTLFEPERVANTTTNFGSDMYSGLWDQWDAANDYVNVNHNNGILNTSTNFPI